MFLCGCEEPIQVNEMLYAHNDRPIGVDYELSTFTDSRLNRYSFVWFSPDWDWNVEAFTHLLTSILMQWDAPLTWAQRRKYFPPGTGATRLTAFWQRERLRRLQRLHRPDESTDPIADIEAAGRKAEEASRIALAQFENEGWATCHDDALIVATKRPESVAPTFATPRFGRDLWLFLILGSAPSPEVFLRPPIRASLEAMFPRLRPSRKFLAWLAENGYTIAYLATDDLNRPGLVVVGTRRIDAKRLRAEGVIGGIETIPSYVWRKSPAFDPRHSA